MTLLSRFTRGFLTGILVLILANAAAAQLLSDCGLPALLGLLSCSDDISRAGFPFVFYEEGGFAYRHIFNSSLLTLDAILGICFAMLTGLINMKFGKKK